MRLDMTDSATAETHTITSVEQLEALYGPPLGQSLVKEIDYISDHYRAFIEKAPFVVLASIGPEGLDCSPRGDPAGFVRVADNKTVMLPDRRGNNRLDTLDERSVIDELEAAMASNHYAFDRLLVALVGSRGFRTLGPPDETDDVGEGAPDPAEGGER